MHDENFAAADRAAVERGSASSVLLAFLKLGLMSFGGPVAHFGYFRDEFVARRKWLDEATYVDLVALCQFLPGPASSQVGISIGMLRAGLKGALAAWAGFTMPSALAMIAFAYGVASWADAGRGAWLHGLKIVAVAVVAQAVWNMARTLTPDRERATLAIGAAVLMLALPSALGQIAVIVLGGMLGWLLLPGATHEDRAPLAVPLSRGIAIGALVLFAALLLGLPLVAGATTSHSIKLIDSFYRSGSLVFGGGHVVLPLLQQQVVPPGWVDNDTFLAGYGAAQAVPGPLFTFAAYLGAVMAPHRRSRRHALPPRHLPSLVPAAGRRAAVLERAAPAFHRQGGAHRDQRRGGRAPARRPLHAGMDERDSKARGFRHRACRVPVARLLEGAAVAGGDVRRRDRAADRVGMRT